MEGGGDAADSGGSRAVGELGISGLGEGREDEISNAVRVCDRLSPRFRYQLRDSTSAKSPTPHSVGSSILQEYDQSLDEIAERAMRSVVQIDVTSYSVPEHGQGDGSQNFQRQRALGSGVIVIRMDT